MNGKEWILCRYGAPDRDNLFHLPGVLEADPPFVVSVFRPAMTNASLATVKCPAPKIKTQLVTSVPSPWTSTTYVWREVTKDAVEIGGQQMYRCLYTVQDTDVWGAGPTAILRPVQPDKGPPLGANPKAPPAGPGDLAAEFSVTEATLGTPPMLQTSCPAKVRFTGSIAVNGKGDVVYRVVHNGAEGNPTKLDFGRGSRRPVTAEFTVGKATRRPEGPNKPASPSLAAGPTGPNDYTGSARIEILKPLGGVLRSDDANYAVRCVATKPGSLQGREPTP